MSTQKERKGEPVDASRRTFLRAGVAGSAAVAAGAGAVVAPAQATESEAEQKKARYKETDHVKKYYATNRY